jgi:undecaprenyl-diphosphatase
VVAVRWVRVPGNRRRIDAWLEAHSGNPAVRLALATGRRVQGPWRFLVDRLTPGNLGLELTTLLAVGAVASFVFFGYMMVLDGDTLTPGDRRAEVWADALRAGFLDDVAELVQNLGSLPVVAAAVALVAIGLLVLRERLEALVLLGGVALTVIGVLAFDAVVVRDAPAGGAAEYPAGAAAYAVAWIAIAVALRRAGPLAATAGLVTIGVVVAAAVALAYVYLREDWFSDVAGGLGLGAFCWSLAGVTGLVARALSP